MVQIIEAEHAAHHARPTWCHWWRADAGCSSPLFTCLGSFNVANHSLVGKLSAFHLTPSLTDLSAARIKERKVFIAFRKGCLFASSSAVTAVVKRAAMGIQLCQAKYVSGRSLLALTLLAIGPDGTPSPAVGDS